MSYYDKQEEFYSKSLISGTEEKKQLKAAEDEFKNLMVQLQKLSVENKEFHPYIEIDPKNLTVSIFLKNSPYYFEWIDGEGADIGVYRDIETKKLVGARLPLENWTGNLPVHIIS